MRYPAFRILLRFDTVVFLLCVVFFLLWPGFDLYVSGNFYDPASESFFLKNNIIASTIYTLTSVVGWVIFVSPLVLIGLSYFSKKDCFVQHRKVFVYLLCATLLGPGLMVNAVFKDHWGRPRPRHVVDFGGSKIYQPPLSPNFECNKCHSFVSGHASVGFYFFSLALLARKRRWFLLPIFAGSVIGAVRVIQGGHFFSDVLFSGWVVWFCSISLYSLFFTKREPGPVNTSLS